MALLGARADRSGALDWIQIGAMAGSPGRRRGRPGGSRLTGSARRPDSV